jgi:DNA adenine methylase
MDYEKCIESATDKDFIYFDPPYTHTKGMYGEAFDHNRFFKVLENLNSKNIKWLLSYDGNRYPDTMIPEDLYKNHYLLDSGNSSFSRLKNKKVHVKESLYSNF